MNGKKMKIGEMNMNLTSDEKRMYAWVVKQHSQVIEDNVFSKFDFEAHSYFEKRKEKTGATEYSFETFAELKDMLSRGWEKEDIMQEMTVISTVTAMKYKPKLVVEEDETMKTVKDRMPDTMEIPEYVYVF